MFGYIKVYKPEMKFKDYETYRSVYCSLCDKLGKNYGIISRLTLNYDFTFLATLKLATAENEPCFENKRCPFNLTKKCKNCNNSNSEFDYITATAMIMLYYKFLDNIADETFFKRILSKFLMKIFNKKYKKAAEKYADIDTIVSEMSENQSLIEKENSMLDACSHPTSDALGKIFAFGENNENEKQILYRLGYCLGRYVYFTDALDDYKKDLKSGSFNPFIVNNNLSNANNIINHSIGEAINAYNLLTIKRYDDILKNILEFGLNNNLSIVLDKQEV